jgi:GT2 family glycosyltransferase
MPSNLPLVTVVTLIYNTNPKFVIEAIESVRINGYPNVQHIIVDDGSPDVSSKEIVKEWILKLNYNCEFHENKFNLGICRTLNNVLKIAKGKYWIICCDDVLLKNRILSDVTLFEQLDDSYALIFSPAHYIDKDGNYIYERYSKVFSKEGVPYTRDKMIKSLIQSNFIVAPSVTFKVEALRTVGGFDESLIFEDYDIYIRLLLSHFNFKFSQTINTKYRWHANSISNNKAFEIERDVFRIFLKHSSNFVFYKRLLILYGKQAYRNKEMIPTYDRLLSEKRIWSLPFKFVLNLNKFNLLRKKILYKINHYFNKKNNVDLYE